MLSLLYVDDEPGLLELGRIYLETTGDFTVTTALSAAEALGLIAQRDFDAIVSDFQMPGMDGIQFLKEIRKTCGQIPFILFTGRGREEVVIEAINNGVDFYLQKGGDPGSQFAELAHKIRQASGRRKAEIALSDSEKRFADIINFLPDATFAIDRSGAVIAWNKAIEEMTGIAASTMLGRAGYEYAVPFYGKRRPILIDLVSEPDEKVAEFYTNIRRDGRMLSAETDLPRPRGRRLYVLAKASPLYDRDGKIVGAIEAIRDITDRKENEEELRAANEQLAASGRELRAQYDELAAGAQRIRESEQKYRTVFETTGTAMLIIEEDATISLVNAEFSRLSGYQREEIENRKRWTEFVVEEDLPRMLAQHTLRRESRDEALRRYEFRFLTRSGGIRDIFLAIDVIPGTKKSVASLLDITEKKKAGDELLAANEQLAASGEELRAQYDELVATEARIRTSEARLTYMLGFYDYAEKSGKELVGYAIEGAGIVTASPLAYLAFLNEDESELSMYAWSKSAMAECSMQEKPLVYKTEKTGLWGEAVRRRRPVITNDYAAPDPAKKGYPPGHPQIVRHMNVPVIDSGRVVLVAGVANKSSDYTESDVNELLLMMQALWTILKQRQALKEQEAAYEQLRKGEEELRMLKISVDQSSDEVFWMDFEGTFLYVNDAACRINGYSREEFKAMKIFDLNPDLTPEIWKGSVSDLRTRKTQLITTRHMRKGGNIADVEIMAVYVNRNGEEYSFAFVRDITGRKRIENALRENEAKFRAIIDQSFGFIGLMTPDGTLIEANRAALALAGIAESAVINRPFWDTPWWSHSKELQDRLRDAVKRAASGETVRLEATHPAADGQLRYIDFSIKPVVDPEGKILYLIPEGRDITGRKSTEEALFDSQQMLQAVLDSIPQRVFWKDRNSVFLGCNKPLALDAGFSDPAEMIGKTDFDHASAATAELYRADDRRVMETGQPRINYEEPQVRADGSEAWLRTTKVPLRNKDGAIIGVLGTYEDITDQKRAESAVREANRKLSLLNSITRHDIRNQLMVAQGYTQLAALSKPDTVVLDFLTRIGTAIDAIYRQIEFSKAYQELGVHAPAWFRIDEVIGSVRPETIAVRNRCSPVEIFADPMIDRVFFNLFDNAVKHGGGVNTVAVSCRKRENRLVITFADNGCGVPEGEKQKIFEKGYGKNTGLGLFLAREILAITGIAIRETGESGRGAVFEITVPEGAFRNPE